jgi:hypothetical protein
MPTAARFVCASLAACVAAVGAEALAKGEAESFGRGLRFEVTSVADANVEKPDAEKYRKVEQSLGSAAQPRGQWLFGTFKLRETKSGRLLDPMPAGQTMALLKAESFASDFKNKDGATVIPAGRYLSVGLPAMKKDARDEAEKWAKLLDWTALLIRPQQTQPNAAGQFENENVFRDVTRVPQDQWAVLSLDGLPAVYVEPLAPAKTEKSTGADGRAKPRGDAPTGADKDKSAGRDAGADKEITLRMWIWNPKESAPKGR